MYSELGKKCHLEKKIILLIKKCFSFPFESGERIAIQGFDPSKGNLSNFQFQVKPQTLQFASGFKLS